MEDKKTWIIALLLVILVAASGWLLYRHYNSAGTADGQRAIDTVEQLKQSNQSAMDDNSTAGGDISAAQIQIESAQSELNGASTDIDNARQSVDSLQESVGNSADTIDDSAKLLDELDASIKQSKANVTAERNIIESVNSGNKTNGASR